MSYRFAIGDNGAPVLLAAVAEAPPDDRQEPETERSQGSISRRRDAVVDAARTLDDLSPQGVEQLVRRRWRGDRAVTAEDIQSFAADARAQRAHDVVDALDFRIRRAVYGRAGSKQMHVTIPRGIIGKSLASLEREELADVFGRLRDRGWNSDQILRHGVRRFDTKERVMRELLSRSS
jgi:hypothetical protein